MRASSIQKIPHSPEVEGAILGCILLAPERAPEFLEKLPLAYLHLIWSAKQRGAPIPRDKAPAFRWCDAAAMHVSTSAPMRCTELRNTVMTVLTVAVRTAERRIDAYRQLGLVQRDVLNLWIPSTAVDRHNHRHDDPPPSTVTAYI